MDSVAGLSLEERVNWNIIEYSKLLRGEENAIEAMDLYEYDGFHNEEQEEDRNLQVGTVWELQELVFEGCVFQHNQQGYNGDFAKFGLISVDQPFDTGTFINCTFYNNSYGNPDDTVRNYVTVKKLSAY